MLCLETIGAGLTEWQEEAEFSEGAVDRSADSRHCQVGREALFGGLPRKDQYGIPSRKEQ